MKKGGLLIAVLSLLGIAASNAQSYIDTVYLKNEWPEMTTTFKDSAQFFRTVIDSADTYYYADFNMNGLIIERGMLSSLYPSVKNGVRSVYDSSGNLKEIYHYQKDSLEGRYQVYFPTGKLRFEVNIQKNKWEGEATSYYETGEVKTKEVYLKDSLISGKGFTKSGSDTVFYPFYVKAQFPGGKKAFLRFLATTTDYPMLAKENDIQGTIYIKATIDKDGQLKDIKALNYIKYLTEESLRVAKSSIKWKPASSEGIQVEETTVFPIRFVLM